MVRHVFPGAEGDLGHRYIGQYLALGLTVLFPVRTKGGTIERYQGFSERGLSLQERKGRQSWGMRGKGDSRRPTGIG
jgi:hypothetical protein